MTWIRYLTLLSAIHTAPHLSPTLSLAAATLFIALGVLWGDSE